jgi:hypothetical protein
MGDDRPHAPRLAAQCHDGPSEGSLAVLAVFCSELSAIDTWFAAESWRAVGMMEGMTASRTAK